jgi:hypothetical protein
VIAFIHDVSILAMAPLAHMACLSTLSTARADWEGDEERNASHHRVKQFSHLVNAQVFESCIMMLRLLGQFDSYLCSTFPPHLVRQFCSAAPAPNINNTTAGPVYQEIV